jgi:stage II sporulation protein D
MRLITERHTKAASSRRTPKAAAILLFFSLSLSACAVQQLPAEPALPSAEPSVNNSFFNLTDDQWQRAATAAMQNREGALIVIDPQTGRLRAVVNERIAFNQAYPPGSTIKPFTALAALRAGLIQRETARQCSGSYQRGSFSMACSHPKSKAAFDLPHALGYSCNDYFGQLGERLTAGSAAATLATFGFGKRAGRLQLGAWAAADVLGDSNGVLVTPLQLLTAYTALVNGGRLLTPQQSSAAAFAPREAARIPISANQRAILLEGMRGVVRYGTAAKAQLDEVSTYVLGKTGTSSATNGFQTQGWFVAFLADTSDLPEPEAIHTGIIVFLKRSHGSTCAEVVKDLLDGVMRRRGDGVMRENSALVKVRSVSEGVTRALPFEEYVTGVVAAEGSVEEELEALKALAVVSRTYALKNSRRHAKDGFDFCSTTHCQRFVFTDKRREQVRRAVRETAGETLRDERSNVADIYFHAACGGHTANAETLWGLSGRPYLNGVRDEYCAERPNAAWTNTITAKDLARTLQKDPRTNVGANVSRLEILQRDATGRALTLAITGAQRKVISGWEFKIIVGRGLGWQHLKSSRFDVARAGEAFVFKGSGFGHGLGLCQEGSHVMAARGIGYREQLAFYLPGLAVRRSDGALPVVEQVSNLLHTSSKRVTMSDEHFRVSYPVNEKLLAAHALNVLQAGRKRLLADIQSAGLSALERAPVEIVVYGSTAEFIQATGRAGWTAAVTTDRKIELQPLALLQRRGILTATLQHELTHVLVNTISHHRSPRWLSEGMAIHYANEGRALDKVRLIGVLSLTELEAQMAQPANEAKTRELYARAYRETKKRWQRQGVQALWRQAAQSDK